MEKWVYRKYTEKDNWFKASEKSHIQTLTDVCDDQEKALVRITKQKRDIIELW